MVRTIALKLSAAALLLPLFYGASLAADLVVGMPNWPSGQASANIIKYGIEKKFGLKVEVRRWARSSLSPGSIPAKWMSHPEVWRPNFDSLVTKYVDEKKTVRLSPKDVAATQGICTTRETADKYGIKDIADLNDPKKTAVFDTDGDGKGEMWIGATTWSSTTIERIRAKSYGYAKTVTLLEMPEDVAMAAVDAAVATEHADRILLLQPAPRFRPARDRAADRAGLRRGQVEGRAAERRSDELAVQIRRAGGMATVVFQYRLLRQSWPSGCRKSRRSSPTSTSPRRRSRR